MQDLADSKRINSNIQRLRSVQAPQPAAEEASMPVSATIVSGLFWPSFQEDGLKLPPAVIFWPRGASALQTFMEWSAGAVPSRSEEDEVVRLRTGRARGLSVRSVGATNYAL